MKQSNRNAIYCRVLILFAALIFSCYAHTLNASWHLDDIPNIVNNARLHIDTLSIKDAHRSLYANPKGSDQLYRPVAMLSFALNWFHGKDNVAGYRLVNIAIHVSGAFFLFLIILKLFSTPHLRTISRENAFFAALLAASLWAVHPIQIQAVTYVVQRMASLAALFYFIAMWAFLSARLNRSQHIRFILYATCALAYLMAFYSKENAILLPASLLLIEFSFFQDMKQPFIKWCFWILVAVGIVLIVTSFLYALSGGWVERYQGRTFLPIERLMTQFRVVLFYLWQIIYPVPDQFSITHDFAISKGFLKPITTAISMFLISAIIAFSVWALHRSPDLKIIGFSVLFFFLNHTVESSFIALELVFEHRNYLPSAFLFLPIALGIKYGLDFYKEKNKAMFGFLVLSVCALLIGIGISTYVRNMDWRSSRTLWQDAMVKAPDSARPLQNLAWGYYSPIGQYEKAIQLYQRAVHLKDSNIGHEAISYFNIAGIYYSQINDNEKAIKYAQKALMIKPDHTRATYVLAAAKAKQGHYEKALSSLQEKSRAKKLLENANHLHLKGLLYLKTSQPEIAVKTFRKCLAIAPNKWQYFREIGFSLLMTNHFDQAAWFFRQANQKRPNQPETLMGLAAVELAKERTDAVRVYIDQWISLVGVDNIQSYIQSQQSAYLGPPVPYAKLIPFISINLIERSVGYKEISNQLDQSFSSKESYQ